MAVHYYLRSAKQRLVLHVGTTRHGCLVSEDLDARVVPTFVRRSIGGDLSLVDTNGLLDEYLEAGYRTVVPDNKLMVPELDLPVSKYLLETDDT
ncbi:hypothetical protein [Sandaracinus amylolyticus]|uniref:hypothetical protein n=1 Tax=Sandaracinus amylolyticus TaxID=927083 RepID=UPI001F1F667D|nr:hypothetical protein [Sandaracinus amylolyticus]UJR83208.1 Hypothetical protein I5071_52740 [Sandaracinus amylolyticus]